MDGYQEMYCQLFNKITDVIDELQKVQQKTEKMFLAVEVEQHTFASDPQYFD